MIFKNISIRDPQFLKELRKTHPTLPVATCEVGATERRSITVDLKAARISYTVGDSTSRLLWQGRGREPVEGSNA